jgi:hypothetical protein
MLRNVNTGPSRLAFPYEKASQAQQGGHPRHCRPRLCPHVRHHRGAAPCVLQQGTRDDETRSGGVVVGKGGEKGRESLESKAGDGNQMVFFEGPLPTFDLRLALRLRQGPWQGCVRDDANMTMYKAWTARSTKPGVKTTRGG